MTNTNLHKALILITFVVLLMILYQHNVGSQHDNSNTCEVYAQKCTVTLDQGQLIIDFPEQLVVEEMLNVKFTLPQGIEIEQVVIEGVNMYMGKLPVHFEPDRLESSLKAEYHVDDQVTQRNGEFFLGSCHLNEMQWQMLITLSITNSANKTEQSTSKVIIVRALFTTQQ
jgi:hypothetical protein